MRITHLPIVDQIRDIRQAHLNCLIKISGVVTRRTGVFPQLQEVMYDCGKCGFIFGPVFQADSSAVRSARFPNPDALFAHTILTLLFSNIRKRSLEVALSAKEKARGS